MDQEMKNPEQVLTALPFLFIRTRSFITHKTKHGERKAFIPSWR
jgi:hypothetical protein